MRVAEGQPVEKIELCFGEGALINRQFVQKGYKQAAEGPTSLGDCAVIEWVDFLTGVSFTQDLHASCGRANQFKRQMPCFEACAPIKLAVCSPIATLEG
ncbi:hypothetical protein DRW41_04300 [Neobacillus piezotolerans]|uniref:Uncharacterized protein n=1 Tax=Neobacillus piezotolerans TaxID=2259171 RepID=A0A3D8GWF3_9BACI|nr:hypothetical protein DRW41_04300 [Neobacillus piezotolerans]